MSDETIIFRGDPKKAILLMLGSAVFVCLLVFAGNGEAWTYLGIAFFGLGFLVSLYTILPGTVQLKADRSGVEMKTMFKPMKLAWSDVDEFYVGYIRSGLSRTKLIGIKYSKSYIAQKTGRKISESLTGMEGAIPNQFNRSAEEICEVLNSYKRQYSDAQAQN